MGTGAWWKHGVVYQVYPRSFQDSNGDGIGDLRGITSRLDHLNGSPSSLGVDAIWLSPFYPSPLADFGYDVADYRDVHPDYGTLADFDELVAEAHARGIRLIVDLVPNHTSDEHPWFVDARSSRTSAHRDWYVWADSAADGGPPNAWLSTFTSMGPAWTWDEPTGQYYLHSFHRKQPDLNWWNPEVRAEFEAILRFWLDRGVDGFRIDVANRTVKVRDLSDDAPVEIWPGVLDHSPPSDVDETHALMRSWRKLVDGYGDRALVGETFVLDPARLASWYGSGDDELHLAFNFMFLRAPWQASLFRLIVDSMEAALPAGAWPDYTLSNHDNSRARSRYDPGHPADPGQGLRRARLGMLMVLTLRGTPFIYYGEEIGQADGEVPPERVVDVGGRDPERTPMQWDGGPGAGFTSGRPWLPIGREAAEGVNVADELTDAGSMLSFTRQVIAFRRGSVALRWGGYRPIDVEDDVFAFIREADGERLLVVLDFSGKARRLDLSVARSDAGSAGGTATGDGENGHQPGAMLDLSTDPQRGTGRIDLSAVELGPDEGLVVRLVASGRSAAVAPEASLRVG